MICNIPDDKPWCYLHCDILETGVEHFTLEDGKLKSTYYDKNGNMVQPSCRDYEGVPCIDKCNITGVYSYGGKVKLATKPELKTVYYIKREGATTECTIDITPEASDSDQDIMKGYLLLCLPCADNNCTDEVNINKILLDSSFKQISLCEYKLVDDPCPEVAQCKADDPWRIDIAKQSVPVEVKNVDGDCLNVDKCPDTAPWGVSLDAQKIDVAVKNAEGDCLNVAQCDGDVFEIQNPADGTPLDVNIAGNDACLTIDNCEGKALAIENPDDGTPLGVNLVGNEVCVTVDNCDGKSLAIENPDDGKLLEVSLKESDVCLTVDNCDGKVLDVKNTESVKVINDGTNCLVVDQCPTKIWKVQIEGDAPSPTGTQDVNIVGSVCLDMKNCPNTVLNVEQTTPVKVINDGTTNLNVNLAGSDVCVDIKNCPDNPLHVVVDDSGCAFIGMTKMANKCVSTDGGTTFSTAEHVRFFNCDKTYEDVYYDIKGVEITGTITLSEDGQECC